MRHSWLLILRGVICGAGLVLCSLAMAQEKEYSVRDVQVKAPALPPSPNGAPTSPAPGPAGLKGTFRNGMGTFDLQYHRGSAQYKWFDGTNQQDKLKFIRFGAIDGATLSGAEQEHQGFVYQAEGANFWFFFSNTSIGAVENRAVYPLYYSFRGPDRGFQRWKVNGGTTLIEK